MITFYIKESPIEVVFPMSTITMLMNTKFTESQREVLDLPYEGRLLVS